MKKKAFFQVRIIKDWMVDKIDECCNYGFYRRRETKHFEENKIPSNFLTNLDNALLANFITPT